MAAWTICLWLSFLAGVFAIGDKRQLSVLSLLPIAIELVVCALLGTQTGFQPIASGVLVGLIMIVWLSWRWQLLELGRWISATIILLLAAGLGVGACMGIGQSRLILRDYYDPPLSPYDYASPLSGLRSYVKDHKDDTLLTVTNLPEGTPVRLAVMDQFGRQRGGTCPTPPKPRTHPTTDASAPASPIRWTARSSPPRSPSTRV